MRTVSVTTAVDEEWTEFVTQAPDLFDRLHCGYWACGVAHDTVRGWLVYVGEDGEAPDDQQLEAAKRPWITGEALPAGFHRWDADLAERAFAEGVRLRGAKWHEEADCELYDAVIQRALFGELLFG